MNLSERIALLEASSDPAILYRLEKIRTQIEAAEEKLHRMPREWAASSQSSSTRRAAVRMTLDDDETP